MNPLQEIVKRTKAYNCLECGKCTSVCPISLLNEKYTPRLLVRKAVMGNIEEFVHDELLWFCLTCRECEERCELDVAYTQFICDSRAEARKLGEEGVCAHYEALHSIMRIMAKNELKQNRLGWVTDDLKISREGEYLYFVGCLPYFDRFFTELELNTTWIATSTIKILNYLGIEPVVMPNEKCCGHDLLWTGDVDNFEKLAQYNIEQIKKTGCKKIVVSCPECYFTLKESYPKYVGTTECGIIHISQLLSENCESLIASREPKAKIQKQITYQDPCRLGRFSGIYEEPRNVITTIMGIEMREMERNRKSAICCGTSNWMNCSTYSKQIQLARLKEAKSTGADLLITCCPKCQIHFKCAMKDKNTPNEAKIEIQDLTVLVANQIRIKA